MRRTLTMLVVALLLSLGGVYVEHSQNFAETEEARQPYAYGDGRCMVPMSGLSFGARSLDECILLVKHWQGER